MGRAHTSGYYKLAGGLAAIILYLLFVLWALIFYRKLGGLGKWVKSKGISATYHLLIL